MTVDHSLRKTYKSLERAHIAIVPAPESAGDGTPSRASKNEGTCRSRHSLVDMAAKIKAPVRIGISGWRYTPWRGVFYPSKLPQRLELHYASRILPTIEINGSFYSLQRPENYLRWHDDTPEDFVF